MKTDKYIGSINPLTMCFFCRSITESSKIYKHKGAVIGKICGRCEKSPVRKLKALLQEPARRYLDLKMNGVLHG